LTARNTSQVAKLDKASFLAELRGMGANKGSVAGAALPAGTGPATAGPPQHLQAQAGAPGWGVLSDSFGLQGKSFALPLQELELSVNRSRPVQGCEMVEIAQGPVHTLHNKLVDLLGKLNIPAQLVCHFTSRYELHV